MASRQLTTAFASVALFAFCTSAGRAAPTTLFVDQGRASCTDSGIGSTTRPFCTIGAAAARAVAGQTVVVDAGTYIEDVTPSRSGTSSAPIVFTTASGAAVTITGKANGFTISGKSWITVRGFDITRTAADGISVSNASNITLSNNHVSYCGQPVLGQTGRGIRLNATTRSAVTGNRVDHNTDFGIFLTNGTTGVTVSHNETSYNARGYERAAAGIHLSGSTGNLVEGNVSHDNEDSGIDFTAGANGNLVRNNTSYRNGDHGISAFQSTGEVIVSNSVYKNVSSGISLYGSSSGATIADNISVDNGINSPRSTGNIRVDPTSTAGATLDYDLVYLSDRSALVVWGTTTSYSLADFVAATGQEAHGLEADPRWRAPDGGDLHLLAGSPAIDSADSGASGESPADGDGNGRQDDPGTPDTGAGPRAFDDRGAYEFQPPGAVAREICGDCLDNDGDGLVDYEDPDCCAQPWSLGLRRMLVRRISSRGHNALALKAVSSTPAPSGLDPVAQDATLQIADDHGELFCSVMPSSSWRRRGNGHRFVFRDPSGRLAGGLVKGRLVVKTGKVLFATGGRKKVRMRPPESTTLRVTVGIGGQCLTTSAALRGTRQGLVYP